MLRRSHVGPFLGLQEGVLRVEFLPAPPDSKPAQGPPDPLLAFLDRLCRLVARLEGRPRSTVAEALRRQERRVRDVRRLAGIRKTLLDRCEFRRQGGAEGAPAIREAVFRARGLRWPPIPGDEDVPYETAGRELGLPAHELRSLFWADRPDRYPLVRAPGLSGRELLDAYNLELARGALLDAESIEFRATGGWKGVFRSLKLARVMARVEREGRSRYVIHVTGPASPWLARPQRYGVRLARVLPAFLDAPGGRIQAQVRHAGRLVPFPLSGGDLPVRRRRGRSRSYDSRWEADLARVLREKIGEERRGWSLHREDTPIVLKGGRVFLPDFTLRHRDGREALVELVGFWTPEYLEEKLRKVEEARMSHLVLVISRRLGEAAALGSVPEAGRIVWFAERPSAGPVLDAAEEVGRRP